MEKFTSTPSNSKNYPLWTKFKAPALLFHWPGLRESVKCKKKDAGRDRQISHASIPGKVVDRLILLQSIYKHRKYKKVISSSRCGFCKQMYFLRGAAVEVFHVSVLSLYLEK